MAWSSIQHRTEWVVGRAIASGGMGTVYEARQLGGEGFEKPVALKVLKDNVSKDPLHCRQLIDEAKLCADLVHENIVQIYNLVVHEGRYIVVMELCDGVTLRQLIDRHQRLEQPFPIDMAAFIVSRVCRGLQYAHERTGRDGRPLGIVHRDVCPNNILITTNGVVKLGDFGIAKANIVPDQEGEVLQGKARYMSPEQASFQPTDPRSDMFSLGIVLWETLAGEPLFQADSPTRTLLNVASMPIPSIDSRRPEAPEHLQAILDCTLQRERERRFPDVRTLGYQLEWLLYHDGFGPTNERLRDYLGQLFPELPGPHSRPPEITPTARLGPPAPRPAPAPIEPTDTDRTAPLGARPGGDGAEVGRPR